MALLEHTHHYGIACTYDEVLRFKPSAADAAKQTYVMGLLKPNNSLGQAVADNFDASISSQNGCRSTHALACLITLNQGNIKAPTIDTNYIQWLSKAKMKQDVTADVTIEYYGGTQKPDMPNSKAYHSALTHDMLTRQAVSLHHARNLDLVFLQQMTN